jgi:hypothetical protein
MSCGDWVQIEGWLWVCGLPYSVTLIARKALMGPRMQQASALQLHIPAGSCTSSCTKLEATACTVPCIGHTAVTTAAAPLQMGHLRRCQESIQ